MNNNGITRKNMIKYLIKKNKTKNLGELYNEDMISKLINYYNNYSKKVIHNIISNILNKESFETEISTIKFIIDNIIEKTQHNTNKELLYIDTLLYIIDKLFLYGRINKATQRHIILMHLNDKLKEIPENNNYKCYDTFISYINFYIESFKKNSEIKGRENTPESATGNSNKTLQQTKSKVIPTISLKIKDIIKGNILKIDKKEIEKEYPGINKMIQTMIEKMMHNKSYKSKKNNTVNYIFQVLGFVNIVNIKYIILFENYYKIVLKMDIDHLSKLIEYIQIIKTNNINSNNILKINKVSQSKFIKEQNGKYVITISNKEYILKDKYVQAENNN